MTQTTLLDTLEITYSFSLNPVIINMFSGYLKLKGTIPTYMYIKFDSTIEYISSSHIRL
jgi:hypothetical protein